MKQLVLDIMRSRILVHIVLFLTAMGISAQNKYEKEVRIPKSQFPTTAVELVSPYLEDAKRVRYYHEVDSTKKSFEIKFKKGKLHYSVEFDAKGALEDVEFIVQPTDIPEDSWAHIRAALEDKFGKVRIKKIQQQYPKGNSDAEAVLKQAFQNLILPYINYELVFSSKDDRGYQTYEGLFNSEGDLLQLRKSFPAKYEYILY